jgi:hypothetical protein
MRSAMGFFDAHGQILAVCGGIVGAAIFWRRRALQESGALGQNGFKGVNIVLRDLLGPVAYRWELDAGKGASFWAQVPSGDQIATRRLVVDLGGGGKREFEFWR